MTKKTRHDDTPAHPPLSELYRKGAHETSPPRLDAAILAEARRAVDTSRRTWSPFGSTWAIPMSVAAVVILSVTLVVFMPHENTPVIEQAPLKQAPPSVTTQTPASPAAAKSAAPAPAPSALERTERYRNTTPAANDSMGVHLSGANARLSADVVSIKTTGKTGAYQFTVTLRSPDTGCSQYADWWEVLREDGTLLYRHLIPHSHVNAQPFILEGGPVPIQSDTVVWVRAHLHPTGYGGTALRGSIRGGFQHAALAPTFAAALANSAPLPLGCER